jgi:Flp pilus assembly protein protease CpaA
MGFILQLFLPFIILLGLLTSYEDIKFGKIRNRYIINAVIISFFLYLFIILYNIIKNVHVDYSYFFFLGINVIIALIIGVILWLNNIWTAADAKLFTAFTILIPLEVYQYLPNKFFPSIFLLINSFVPYFFYLSFKGLFLTSGNDKIKAFKNIKVLEIIEMILAFFGISWFVRLFSIDDVLIRFTTIIILYMIFEKFTKANIMTKIAILTFFAIVRIIVDKETIVNYEFWKNFLTFTSVFLVFKFFIRNLVRRAIIHDMPVKKLKPGMILAEIIEKRNKGYVKSANVKASFIDLSPEGLTRSDIKRIKKTGIKKIKVIETICFAPFIFFGTILTIIAQGNLFNLFFNRPFNLLGVILNFFIVTIVFLLYINTKKYKKEILLLKIKR